MENLFSKIFVTIQGNFVVSIIVSYNSKFVIGKDNKIPWYIPSDLSFFKEKTINHTVVMGRNTWESIPERFKPLSERKNFIVSKTGVELTDTQLEDHNICIFSEVEDAINAAKNLGDVWIIGGSQIYNYCLDHDLVDQVIASELNKYSKEFDVDGDAFFPDLRKRGYIPELYKSMGINGYDVYRYDLRK